MSPSVGNFVHDLVEMAKAMETLPQVQMELERMREQHIEDGNRIVRLETRLMDRASEIESLNARIRSLEVERDDASFRQLEAEDKVASVGREIGAMQDILRGIDLTINPPKPEPTPEPVPESVWEKAAEDWAKSGQGESSFIPAPTPSVSSGESVSEQTSATSSVSEVATSGESVTNPTAHSTEATGEGSTNAPSQNVEPILGVGMPDIVSRPVDQPYLGKHYIDIPRYVSYTDWVAGGGTYDGYWHGRSMAASS